VVTQANETFYIQFNVAAPGAERTVSVIWQNTETREPLPAPINPDPPWYEYLYIRNK